MASNPSSSTNTSQTIMDIPLFHRYGLTLLMTTPSELRQQKDNDEVVQQFLEDCELEADMIPVYKAAIHNFDKNPALSDQLKNTAALLAEVFGGTFYPLPPCPRLDDAAKIMIQLAKLQV
jgi:hypothetical protein